jgi:hypothetical protein
MFDLLEYIRGSQVAGRQCWARSKPDFSNRQKIIFQVWTGRLVFASDAGLARQRVGEVPPPCKVHASNIALNE